MAKKNNLETVQNEQLSATETLVNKNRKLILGVLAAILVIGIGWYLYHQYVAIPRENKASTELAKGQEYFANQQFDKALNGDGAAFKGFKAIASDYSSTDAGNLANLYAGLCYANLNKWTEAAKALEEYSPANDEMISPAATAALGNAYAHLNQLDKAVETLKKAAKMADSEAEGNANNSLSPTFLIQAGEILESQNKKDDALQIYQDIKKKYVNSPIATEIDKYIERASTK